MRFWNTDHPFVYSQSNDAKNPIMMIYQFIDVPTIVFTFVMTAAIAGTVIVFNQCKNLK